MDKKTRKLIATVQALHPNEDRLFLSRNEGKRRLSRIKVNAHESIKRLEDYIKKSKERLIIAAS